MELAILLSLAASLCTATASLLSLAASLCTATASVCHHLGRATPVPPFTRWRAAAEQPARQLVQLSQRPLPPAVPLLPYVTGQNYWVYLAPKYGP